MGVPRVAARAATRVGCFRGSLRSVFRLRLQTLPAVGPPAPSRPTSHRRYPRAGSAWGFFRGGKPPATHFRLRRMDRGRTAGRPYPMGTAKENLPLKIFPYLEGGYGGIGHKGNKGNKGHGCCDPAGVGKYSRISATNIQPRWGYGYAGI